MRPIQTMTAMELREAEACLHDDLAADRFQCDAEDIRAAKAELRRVRAEINKRDAAAAVAAKEFRLARQAPQKDVADTKGQLRLF